MKNKKAKKSGIVLGLVVLVGLMVLVVAQTQQELELIEGGGKCI